MQFIFLINWLFLVLKWSVMLGRNFWHLLPVKLYNVESNGKFSSVVRVFALQAVFEEGIEPVNWGITVFWNVHTHSSACLCYWHSVEAGHTRKMWFRCVSCHLVKPVPNTETVNVNIQAYRTLSICRPAVINWGAVTHWCAVSSCKLCAVRLVIIEWSLLSAASVALRLS
jgi:hypothetical protein